MKITPQSNKITNAEPLRVPIIESYPDELQPVDQATKPIFFQSIRIQHSTAKNEKLPKMRSEK